MIELISLIAKSLVKQPDAVSVTMVQKGNVEVYELHVAPEDMGKVIGKQGRIAKAIRSVVKAAAIKENKKISLLILFKREYSNGRNDITCPCSSKSKSNR